MPDSRAFRELRRRAAVEKWGTGDLARLLGVSDSITSRILAGKRGPSLALAVRLEERLGIRAAWWVERGGEPQTPAGTGAP